MRHITGNLVITKENAKNYEDVVSVGGYLNVLSGFNAPLLNSVSGYLDVSADFTAPLLTSVGGIDVRADLNAPMLTSVGGYLDVRADFNAPMLTSVGGHLIVFTDLNAPLLKIAHGVPATLLAKSNYCLFIGSDGYFYAGCRKFTLEEALDHWGDRSDDRAIMFTKAIKEYAASKGEIK